jgi:hypothetical protein
MVERNINGVYNNPNSLIEIKESPPGLIALRTELAKPENKDIAEIAQRETTFEGSLATIAERLNILVDGVYDVEPLCQKLAEEMKKRHRRIISI